ncbi:MAG: helix-turn-helix transcriptional regulator [Nitriliruptoraceae bacterium]|nr:helix-turn-helix transcriptional regulator [Nitriliruptoraceae bacterium]
MNDRKASGPAERPGMATPMPVDAGKLKALAHPLRVRMYGLLSEEGPATASQLGARIDESSGTTSYHLRQLADHGFIEEDPDRGTRRDRYWRVRPGGFNLDARRFRDDPAATAALRSVRGELYDGYARPLLRWFEHGLEWDESWIDGSVSTMSRFVGTAQEMQELRDEVMAVIDRHVAATRERPEPPDVARITAQFHIFPGHRVDAPEGSADG